MTSKKIILLIVEGPSDNSALGMIVNRIFEEHYDASVSVVVVHGDITSEKNVNPQNISKIIGDMVKEYAHQYRLNQSDFAAVYQIIDMDGVFVPNDMVVEDCSCNHIKYGLCAIKTNDKSKTIKRNGMKRQNVNKILSLHYVWNTIPYKAFYMSCNLDHALYDKFNSSDREKEIDAHAFAKKYKDNLGGFLEFISNETLLPSNIYFDTWEFIKKDNNSLHRHTNLALMFE